MATEPHLALVLTGGGARAAYQVGFLRHLASRYPNLSPGIVTGVSAGGIIAAHLASRSGDFAESVDRLVDLWRCLRMEDVFRVNPRELTTRMARWGLRLMSGGAPGAPHARSLVDTTPLREYLSHTLHGEADGTIPGIAQSLEAGRLVALTLTSTSYTTGQSVTWVQGIDGCGVRTWERPQRKGIETSMRVDHVLASSALPLLFPAVDVDGAWYGDGGIRSPLRCRRPSTLARAGSWRYRLAMSDHVPRPTGRWSAAIPLRRRWRGCSSMPFFWTCSTLTLFGWIRSTHCWSGCPLARATVSVTSTC